LVGYAGAIGNRSAGIQQRCTIGYRWHMTTRRSLWRWAALGLLLLVGLSGCGGQTSSTTLSSAARILLQARSAKLHDTTFTIQFTTGGATSTGTGIFTSNPIRFALNLTVPDAKGKPTQQEVIGDGVGGAIFLYAKLKGDPLWSTLDDGEDGYFVNYDTDILNYDQLSSVTLVSAATMDGQTTWHLHATASMQLFALDGTLLPVSGPEEVWVRQSDGLPVAITKNVSGPDTSGTGNSATIGLQATYHFQKWNAGASVTLPDPSQIAASG
jgi:hypothetical protein